MSVARKKDLFHFLADLGTHPKKRLSQNFLVDKNIVDKIIREARIQQGECVLEIGAGPGALTEELIKAGAHVIAVEKDEAFAERLKRFSQIEVFSGDICDFDLEKIPLHTKVVSNLPYHLTSPILGRLLPHFDRFSELIVMVQKEVALRMVAPKGKDFSAFSLFVQFFSDPKLLFQVSPTSFYPVPKVTSEVVRLTLKKRECPFSQEDFFKTVKMAFQHRRKQLQASLKSLFPSELIAESLEKIGRSSKARPEELTIDEWLLFYSEINLNSF